MIALRERIASSVASGLRDVVVLAVLCVLLLSAWTCLVLGLLGALRPALGPNGAFFALSVAMLLLGSAVALIAKALRRRPPPPAPLPEGVLPLATLALPHLASRAGLRLGMVLLAGGLVAAAVMLQPSRPDRGRNKLFR